MLYIKKKEAPRSMRAKVAEIKSSPAWKHIQLEDTKALRQQFDLLPKQDIRRLHKKGSCTPKQVQNEMERLLSESPRKPFVGVTVYYLRRKYRQLIHQNHTG
jgi:hypothetical protein